MLMLLLLIEPEATAWRPMGGQTVENRDCNGVPLQTMLPE